jgi:LacI family transcriptional regulator
MGAFLGTFPYLFYEQMDEIMSKNLNKATIFDVARVAGVSKSTVSRVLNARDYISPDTVKRVQDAIDELNYVPQASARGLVSQRTKNLGLVLNNLAHLFMPPLLAGIDEICQEKGYSLLVSAVGHMYDSAGSQTLGPHNTDGILAYADCYSDQQLCRFSQQNFPVVLIHRYPPDGTDLPAINAENRESTRQLVNHLIQVHGRRRIVFLRGPKHQQDSIEREIGYQQALSDNNIVSDSALIADGEFAREQAEQAIGQLHANKVFFDAVFAGDDVAAVGVIRKLKELGYRIPEEVAVVGFDDNYFSADIAPTLTTVAVPFDEIGREATRVLIELIETGSSDSHIFPAKVVLRKSCGC